MFCTLILPWLAITIKINTNYLQTFVFRKWCAGYVLKYSVLEVDGMYLLSRKLCLCANEVANLRNTQFVNVDMYASNIMSMPEVMRCIATYHHTN